MEKEQSIDQFVDHKDLTKLKHALNVGYDAIEYKIKSQTEWLPTLKEARELSWNDEEEFQRNEIEIKEMLEDIAYLEVMIKSKDQIISIAERLQPIHKLPQRLDEDLENIIKKFDQAVDLVISGYEGWIRSLNSVESNSHKSIETKKLRISELMANINYFQECRDIGLKQTITQIRKNTGAHFLTWVFYLQPSYEEIQETIDKLSRSKPTPDLAESVTRKLTGIDELKELGVEIRKERGYSYDSSIVGGGNRIKGELTICYGFIGPSDLLKNMFHNWIDRVNNDQSLAEKILAYIFKQIKV